MNSNEPINTNFNAVNPAFSNNQAKNDKKSEKKADPNRNKKRYAYKVKDNTGKIVNDYFDAENEVEVQSFLNSQGYNVIEIKEDKVSNSLGLVLVSTRRKMKLKDLVFFLTQLSTLIKAGIPLVEAMAILSRQTKDKHTRNIYRRIVFELNKGVSFSECLEKQGNTFPRMLVNMVKTSELTGNLTEILDEMAQYYRRSDTNRKQLINAMIYPSAIMIFAVAILTFVILYVVPSFTKMYSEAGSELPALTQAIISFSKFLGTYYMYIIAIILIVSFSIVYCYRNLKGFRYVVQYMGMHIPVIKNIITYNEIIMFTSTFSTLLKHDVFITDSMEILGKISNNEIYKALIKKAIENLSVGDGLSKAFKNNWAFPDIAYEMLLTGERTGKLGAMMENVANYYQEEQTNTTTRLKSLVEPIMIILLSVIVGVILLAVVLPMFDIYSKMI